MYVEYAYADTSYYCGKTCQAKQAAEKAKKEVTVKKTEPCYGNYCDKNDKKKTPKAEPCYGIHCKKETITSNTTTPTTPTTPTKSNQISKEDIIRSISIKNFISLRVSNACKHISSCPNVKDLADKFDNSNRYLSGDFYFDNKTDAWKRTSPKIPNAFELYKFMDQTPWVLWVDPDDYTWDRSKQIIIEPSLHYIDRSDTIDELRMRYEYQGLYLKPCARAVIGWENNGSAILLDVLKHFYSNCKEQVKYDPTIPIFMGTKIFEDCNQQCLYMKQRLKNELKAEAFAYGGSGSSTPPSTKPPKSDLPCYGIYCKDQPITKEETVTQIKDKEKVRKERLEELENTQACEKFKARDLKDNKMNKRDAVDCNDKKERDLYLTNYLAGKIHLKEIEDIKTCENKKRIDIIDKKMNNMVDCNNKDQRDKYLATK